MNTSQGRAAHWAGFWSQSTLYNAGAIVVDRHGYVQCSKRDRNKAPPAPPGVHNDFWAFLVTSGAMPSQVTHSWNASEMQYPCGDDEEMSEVATVCKDCIKDADFKNAFNPEKHLYIIREVGPPR